MPAKACALFFMITLSPKGHTRLTTCSESAVIILEAMLATRTPSWAALDTYGDLRADAARQASLRPIPQTVLLQKGLVERNADWTKPLRGRAVMPLAT
jgi:hypothetical protein